MSRLYLPPIAIALAALAAACQGSHPPPRAESVSQVLALTAQAADLPIMEFGFNSRPACAGVELMLKTPRYQELLFERAVQAHYWAANPDVRAAIHSVETELQTGADDQQLGIAMSTLVAECQKAGYDPTPSTDNEEAAGPAVRTR